MSYLSQSACFSCISRDFGYVSFAPEANDTAGRNFRPVCVSIIVSPPLAQRDHTPSDKVVSEFTTMGNPFVPPAEFV